MAHDKMARKLETYLARLDSGRAHKIKRADVERVVAKLHQHCEDLRIEAEAAPEKAARLAAKIKAAHDLLARAHWLQDQIARPPSAAAMQPPTHQD